ncbi:MAG: hypothetical protein QOD60_1313 [Solirubrobacterales bacterium]|jgi:hypothetical protein|nr:hypothetical protein [Solirubrobacterales bacterium]
MTRFPSLFTIIYLVVGVLVASNHHYLSHLSNVDRVVSALLAIGLWPLVLFGANLHVHF